MYQAIHQILPLLAGVSFVAWLFGPMTGAAMSTVLRRNFCNTSDPIQMNTISPWQPERTTI